MSSFKKRNRDSYCGNDPDLIFLFFYNHVARELASKLAVFFRSLVKRVGCPACWRLADVVAVPKVYLSSDIGDY